MSALTQSGPRQQTPSGRPVSTCSEQALHAHACWAASGTQLWIIDHVLQLGCASLVHFDPTPVLIDAKTRSAFQLIGIDATCCLAPAQPRLLRLVHQSMQIRFVLVVALD